LALLLVERVRGLAAGAAVTREVARAGLGWPRAGLLSLSQQSATSVAMALRLGGQTAASPARGGVLDLPVAPFLRVAGRDNGNPLGVER